jgi:hypothetical protein
VQDLVSTELEADLGRLEAAIRQLKIQYDMFFAGSVPKPPLELRAEVERLIKRYSHASIRKYAFRFHYNALVSRFNTLSELWTRTIRTLEEGERSAPAFAEKTNGTKVFAQLTVVDPAAEKDHLKVFHARLLEARKRSGEKGRLSFDSFLKGIDAQAGKIRQKTGCDRVELRVILHDRKVVVKARPGR